MSDSNQSTALAHLTATYTDSDASDDESHGQTSSNKGKGKSVSGLVSYSYVEDHDKDEGDEENDDSRSYWVVKKEKPTPPPQITQIDEEDVSTESTNEFTASLLTNGNDDVILPPEPPGRCSSQLQEKISRLYERKLREGKDMNASIQKRKDFRNPSIYEKLISFCLIDELGTNYPPEIYDPHSFGDESFYEELAKAQKIEMDKRQKERTKVEFVSGTKKNNSSTTVPPTNEAPTSTEENKKRKSKWDVGATQSVAMPTVIKPLLTQPPGIVPVTTTASGTKATVISAFGTITKKAKQ